MNARASQSPRANLLVGVIGAVAIGACGRRQAPERSVEEIAGDARERRQAARRMVQPRSAQPNVAASASLSPPLPREARDAAIDDLLIGRAALGKKAWKNAASSFARVIEVAPFDLSALHDLATAERRGANRTASARLSCVVRMPFGGPHERSHALATRASCAVDDNKPDWAAHWFDASLAVRFDPEVKRSRDALGTQPRVGSGPRPPPCTEPKTKVEELCQCLVSAVMGEPCLPSQVSCVYEGDQTPNGDLFALRVGRDADFGIAPATFLAEWRDGHARVVSLLGQEDTGLWFRAPQTVRVKSFVPLSPATDAAPWVLRVEQRTLAQGLLEETEEVVERAFFCHRPTTERAGRCPLDIVVRARNETRAKIDGTEPLADAMERRAGAASRAHPLRETRVGYRVEGNKLVTTLEAGTPEDLPLGTIGSFTLE